MGYFDVVKKIVEKPATSDGIHWTFDASLLHCVKVLRFVENFYDNVIFLFKYDHIVH